MQIQTHLGDGAYFTIGVHMEGDAYLTANHHDPEQATDAVYLDLHALRSLYNILKLHFDGEGNV